MKKGARQGLFFKELFTHTWMLLLSLCLPCALKDRSDSTSEGMVQDRDVPDPAAGSAGSSPNSRNVCRLQAALCMQPRYVCNQGLRRSKELEI